MSNLWKITKCSVNAAALSGLSHLKKRKLPNTAQAVVLNLPKRSSTMARLVFRITVNSIVKIGQWLMVGFICLALVPVAGLTVFGLIMWATMSVATDKLKRTLKG